MDSMYMAVQDHAAEIMKKAREIADSAANGEVGARARIVQMHAGEIAAERRVDSVIAEHTAEIVKATAKIRVGKADPETLGRVGAILEHAGDIVAATGTIARIREGWQQEGAE